MKEDTYYEIAESGRLERLNSFDAQDKVLTTEQPKQTAINEETGEINWDCPCLKSALAPPCGDFFREAFSCFVASRADPKGSDCIEQFTKMQDCFREHPDIYMRGEGNDDYSEQPPSVRE